MSVEHDRRIDDLLREASVAVAPSPGDLTRALSSIRGRLAGAPVVLHDVSEPTGRGESPPPPAGGDSSLFRWVSGGARKAARAPALPRLLRGAATLGVGFALGVQYARQDENPQPALVLPSPAARPSFVPPVPETKPAPALEAEPLTVAQAVVEAAAAREAAPAAVPARVRTGQPRGSAGARRSSRAPVPAHEAPSPHPELLSFAQVLERLERAQRAERDLSPELALQLLDELDARADRATLRDERLVTRVLAACDVGDVTMAERAAHELAGADQASVYTGRIEGSCAASAVDTAPAPNTERDMRRTP